MEKLNKILQASLNKKGIGKEALAAQVCYYAYVWSNGECKPVSFQRGVLKIGVKSSSQSSEYQMKQEEIIKFINEKLKKVLVREVRFVIFN